MERTLKALRDLSTTDRKISGGEPTLASMRSARRGDTVHIDAIDRFGNMIAAMPSGGWLQSSPVIPELGFMLNSRAQMFWLEESLPASLAARQAPAHDAHADLGGEGRRALHGLRLARRRPAGAVAAPALPAPCPSRPEPAGGHRPADVAHGAFPVVLLPARAEAGASHGRGELSAPRSSTICAPAATRSRSHRPGRSDASWRQAATRTGCCTAPRPRA